MGVKSLWTLLAPVGRPVMLETTEGKSMAIDSSIWIYQFQATMRDKEGRALVNAHVLGFLRRISKLLFYGIKPVFVFDGGAPALKRNTLNERRKKKSGAAASHHKLAEKLLAAQMRREALNHTQRKIPKTNQPRNVELTDDTVYMEDIDGSAPRTPAKRNPPPPSSTSAKKIKFHDHDPYNLPEVDMNEAVNKATRSAAPDPRLATEDELRAFIEDMRPGDFDINSPAFRELPTEVQYEIIGDLRLKSRQTSYDRLHKMLKSARTPMDFSRQQIMNLKQRNSLTQQLLMTTDSIGSAHIAIPVRIASERNREYVLIKNEGDEGGWVLGIKDIGTREKPILLDHDESKPDANDESDADMEEVEVPIAAPDPDLREYQREMALSALSRRDTDKGLHPMTAKGINRKGKSNALFDAIQTDATTSPILHDGGIDSDEDDLVAYAIQASLDQHAAHSHSSSTPKKLQPTSAENVQLSQPNDHFSDDDFYVNVTPPTSIQSALSMANASPTVGRTPSTTSRGKSLFGNPTLLSSPSNPSSTVYLANDSAEDMEDVVSSVQPEQSNTSSHTPPSTNFPGKSLFGNPILLATPSKQASDFHANSTSGDQLKEVGPVGQAKQPEVIVGQSSSRNEMSEYSAETQASSLASWRSSAPSTFPQSDTLLQSSAPPPKANVTEPVALASESDESNDDMEEIPLDILPASIYMPSLPSQRTTSPISVDVPSPTRATEAASLTEHVSAPTSGTFQEVESEPLFTWSRSPSPGQDLPQSPPPHAVEDWDAAQEMDPHAEEGQYAQFMSQVKGRNVEDVRKEIDEEIRGLNQQRKAAIRDSEDITQQMIAQIMTMLRLFGIPYITAPMEAEAQCAELVSLRLVDGVITDDSDVFLFGAQRVFKNMFNQSKTVECFLATDLQRELGLDRDTLIQLAYLLGSDYTEGLPGVGPVVAMELLKEFPSRDGLFKFKDWWTKVQSGKDREEDNKSKFRKQFKKKFKNLYLPDDWPNSVVRDAYYHPAVDNSDEPFKWGMPDLDGLREFFQAELGWRQNKVDELLLPIIQKMNKRNQVAALNKQGTLNDFLDISAGSGSHAPRQRQAYASTRLQQVISDFRDRQRRGSAVPQSKAASEDEAGEYSGHNDNGPPAKKRRKKEPAPTDKSSKGMGKSKAKAKAGTSTAKARGGKATKSRARNSKADESSTSDEEDNFSEETEHIVPKINEASDVLHRSAELNLRPRPKPRPQYISATNIEQTAGSPGSETNKAPP